MRKILLFMFLLPVFCFGQSSKRYVKQAEEDSFYYYRFMFFRYTDRLIKIKDRMNFCDSIFTIYTWEDKCPCMDSIGYYIGKWNTTIVKRNHWSVYKGKNILSEFNIPISKEDAEKIKRAW